MPVSAGLQKYFNGRKKDPRDVGAKLKKIEDHIDPKFLGKFDDFRDRILTIVGEDPESEDIIHEEIDALESKLSRSGRQNNLKKAATVIRNSEIA